MCVPGLYELVALIIGLEFASVLAQATVTSVVLFERARLSAGLSAGLSPIYGCWFIVGVVYICEITICDLELKLIFVT